MCYPNGIGEWRRLTGALETHYNSPQKEKVPLPLLQHKKDQVKKGQTKKKCLHVLRLTLRILTHIIVQELSNMEEKTIAYIKDA